MAIASIIFLQGDEGHRVVDALTHTGGVVRHGATAASVEAVVDYLAQWDHGEYHDIGQATRAGSQDDRVQVDAYLLTWNAPLGYVGLEVVLDGIDHTPIDVTTCRGCDQPVDYCQDHTHAPDMDADVWREDYDAVTAALSTDETEEEPMTTFEYVVRVEAATREQAERVMAERLDHDEEYGFGYTIGYDYETSED